MIEVLNSHIVSTSTKEFCPRYIYKRFLPDNNNLVNISSGHIFTCDINTGTKEINAIISDKIFVPLSDIKALTFDGNLAVIGGESAIDHDIYVVDLATRRIRHTLRGHTADIKAAAFSSDGKYLLTGSADKTARLWDVETGKSIFTMRGHSSPITHVAFRDNKYALTASEDYTVRTWNINRVELYLHACGVLRDFADNPFVASRPQLLRDCPN